MALITPAMRVEVSQLFVALFGRAPAQEGLGFWVNELANDKSLTEVAQAVGMKHGHECKFVLCFATGYGRRSA